MRYAFMGLFTFVLVALDQYTKWIVNTTISFSTSIPVTSFFSIVHVRNTGAAFGLLSNPESQWQLWLFLALTLVALLVIISLARKSNPHDYIFFLALSCIASGAIGNATDRIIHKSVIDFLDFHYATWHWPAFNVADMCICFGASLLLILLIKRPETIGSEKKN